MSPISRSAGRAATYDEIRLPMPSTAKNPGFRPTELAAPAQPVLQTLAQRSRAVVLQHALLLVAFATVVRLPALVHPIAIDDEAVYAVVANEIVHGGLPYVNAIERKPPLLFWTYAAVFELFGPGNVRALHLAAFAWLLATMAVVYALARSLFDDRAALFAALACGLYTSWGPWKDLAWNGEMLMNLPIAASAWVVLARGSRLRLELLLAGALLALAFLLKQPAAIAAPALGLYLLLPSYRRSRGITLGSSALHATLLTAGFVATLAATALVLRAQGILADAYYWTITDHDLPHVFVRRGLLHTLAFALACAPLVIAAGLALRDRRLFAGKEAERTALTLLLAASVVGTCASGRFYPHYYVQLVPPLALLAAPVLARAWDADVLAPHRWSLVLRAGLVLSALLFFAMHWQGLWPRRQGSATAHWLRAHAAPGDRLFVWGHAAQIYLQSGLRPASRYITTFPLTGYIFGEALPEVDTRARILPGAWDTLERELRDHPPAFIVDTQRGTAARYPIREFPRLARLIDQRYRPVYGSREDLVYENRAF